jgi:hypothetical protein
MTFYRSTNGITWTLFHTWTDPYNLNQNSQNITGFEWDGTNNLYFAFFNELDNATGLNRCYRIQINAAGTSSGATGSGALRQGYGPSVDSGAAIYSTPYVNEVGGYNTGVLIAKFTKSGAADGSTAFADNRSTTTYPNKAINQMAYGNGILAAAANYDLLAYSPDNGTTFTNVIGTFSGQDIAGVAYGASKFVAIAANGAVATSTDGAAWAVVATLPSGVFGGLAYAAGVFIAKYLGFSYWSTDGINWTTQALPQSSYSNNLSGSSTLAMIGTGQGVVYTSA